MPTFNKLVKNIYRLKTHKLFKITNIYPLFRGSINVE